ncbi:hypothetical protein O0881_04170 [Janthinobacterium sp. SUN100]|uniref:hypothetical protein n=1 Tax=Janthinobacterium sp. SUN100 TaxID=3004101 RepID=UPI0025B0EDAA|nr:hypothetical protein [Janthinobacterium sp. SUN100]MDN2701193.1 hypothetical protein [Janthinobacterium sp. SUN100]
MAFTLQGSQVRNLHFPQNFSFVFNDLGFFILQKYELGANLGQWDFYSAAQPQRYGRFLRPFSRQAGLERLTILFLAFKATSSYTKDA